MKQRGITEAEVEHVLAFPAEVRKSFDETRHIIGHVNNRRIDVKAVYEESNIKIITVM